jgi:hypothetical protein
VQDKQPHDVARDDLLTDLQDASLEPMAQTNFADELPRKVPVGKWRDTPLMAISLVSKSSEMCRSDRE